MHATMYNTYFSSMVYAVRCQESFTLSSNGYTNFWYERFDRTPSHCSSCCGCCSFATYRVPVKSSLLNGLRQSTLLQLPASRRLVLGGGDLYFSRLPSFDLHRDCYELNSSVNERTVCNRSIRRIKGRCLSTAPRKGREICYSFDSDDVESVLSLLSEEADKDASSIKLKNESSSKRMEAEKKRKKVSKERNLSLSKKVETEKKGNLKQHETSTIDLRREDEKPNKERETFNKGENDRKRRDVSSCSSFYSLSSGNLASDLEVQDNHDLEELSVGYEKDNADYREGQVKDELNMQGNDSQKLHGVSNQERTASGANNIDWNLKKKLTDVTMQETVSTKEHKDKHSRAFRTHESSYGKASISRKQVECEKGNSSFVKDLDKRMEKAYIKAGKIRKHQSTDTQESGYDEVETTLASQKIFSGREGNLEISETLLKERSDGHKKFVGSTSTTGKETSKSKKTFSGREENPEISDTLLHETRDERNNFVGSTSTTGKNVINRNSQKYMRKLKVEDTERTLNTRMKNLGDKRVSILSSVQGAEELQHQKGEKIVTQAKERRKSQQFSEVSQVHKSNVEDTSIVKSRTRINDWDGNSNLSTDARDTWRQTDKRTNQSIQDGKGFEYVNTLSEGYASDEKQVSSSQRISGKVRFIPKSKSMSVVKTRESSCQTDDERIANFDLYSEDQRPRNLSVSDETASREEASFHGSLNLVSEAGKRVILVEGGERSSAGMLTPSSSSLMGRSSAHVELNAEIANPEIIVESSDSVSSALYDNAGRSPILLSGSYSTDGTDQAYSEPSNIIALEGGALGSAYRLEKSSKQLVDEFVERVRHEVATSETQEPEVTGTRLAIEDDGNQIFSSRQQGSQNDSQLKESGSSHSSGFPGTKGPSDEIWDVNEPSVEQSLVAEEPEISKETEKTIVSRTGRSMWSMIADIVRLRWGSRTGSSTSAGRSCERNSPNKSDSETWFSGQEHEETSKSNVTKETSVLPQTMTYDKSKPSTPYTLSEGDVYDTKKLKDKGINLEVGSSSPNTLESGSTSVGASYASGEENANRSEDGKDLKVSTSGIKNVEFPIPLPARGPPVVGKVVNIGGSDMSGTESIVPIKELVAPVQSESSGLGKRDGELKQRKFQRNKQVLRDRFDDWEEAYKLEFEQRRMDEMFMKEALLEAKKAADTWEVPIGAVLVQNGKVIARGCNLVEELRDSTAHAEMICIREASSLLRTWRLSDTTLYVTLEPCPMCAGAILQARIDTVVWGAPNKLLGADGSWIRLFPDGGDSASEQTDIPPAPVHPFHPKIKIRRGVLASECADAMQQFFQLRRKKKKEESSNDPSSLPVTHHHPSKFLNKIHDIFHVKSNSRNKKQNNQKLPNEDAR